MPDTFASPFEDEEDDYDVLIEMNGYGAQELPPPSAQSASYNSQVARDYGPSMAGSFEQSRFIRGTRAAVLAAADNASRSRSQSLAATNRRQQLAGMAASLSNLSQPGYGTQGGPIWNESSAGMCVPTRTTMKFMPFIRYFNLSAKLASWILSGIDQQPQPPSLRPNRSVKHVTIRP